jgi:ribose transport system permease protein
MMTTTGIPAPKRSIVTVLAASLRNFSAVWLLAFFVILFSITAPETFPTALTLKIVLTDQVTVGLLALALLVPLCAGVFDLSIGAMLAVAMVSVSLLSSNGYGIVPATVITLVGCAAFGVFNGFLIVKLHINDFIATLGSSQLLLAFAYFLSKNQQLLPPLPDWFVTMSHGSFAGLNYDVYFLIVIAVILWFFLEHTPTGRAIFAMGGNREAARLAGVPTSRLIFITMMISALLAALAGILYLSKIGVYTQEYGPGFLFPAFAAVFFGATQFKGRANVWGTLVALFALSVGVAGLQLTFFGNEFWVNPLFNGAALIIAVALASRKHVGKAYRNLRKGQAKSETTGEEPAAIDTTEAIPAAREHGLGS